MDIADTVTVDSPRATCDGKVEMRLSTTMRAEPTGDIALVADGAPQRQTCSCEYDADERDTLTSDARLKLGDI